LCWRCAGRNGWRRPWKPGHIGAAAAGGALTSKDLEAHEANWVQPLAQPYREVVLHEIPPNGQGLAAQIALGILRHRTAPPLDSADWYHLQIEAMKIAAELRKAGIAVIIATGDKSLKGQMRQANSLGIAYALILGEQEIANRNVVLRDMGSGEQKTILLAEIASRLLD